MLIEFSVGNFRSFKEPIRFSMVATKLTALNSSVDLNNSIQVNDHLSLLTSAGVYGANASGKSNLIKAMRFMRHLVGSSSKESQANEPIQTIPFLLDAIKEKEPSFFEVVFLQDNVIYRYGFEANIQRIESEWLFFSPHGKESKLFTREGDDISISRSYKGGTRLKSFTRSNALFLSVSAQFNQEIAKIVLDWFKSFNVISGLDDKTYGGFTLAKFTKDESFRTEIVDLLRNSDFGINDVVVKKANIHDPGVIPENMPKELREYILNQVKDKEDVYSFLGMHSKKCENGLLENIPFEIEEESEGTQKLFYLSGPIIDTLRKGKVLVIDEIEARLHTLLTRMLIQLFNSETTNPNHAQLIFATHDTNLLTNKLFRRDQLWFVEKGEDGASHLYSLAELRIRNDASFGADYLQGKYGAIPIFGEIRATLDEFGQVDNHEPK